MALPASGQISMGDINVELGRARTTLISLDTAENGGYVAINTNSTNKPSATNPAYLSEWYGYNHTYVADTTPPTTPGTLSAVAYPCYVALTWGASTDNSGSVSYNIYKGGIYFDNTTETFFEDITGDLVIRTYTVKAVDGSGNLSSPSNQVSKRALAC